MNKKLKLFFTIFGISLIVLGIILTVIPLFNFDSDTFKLSSALLSGIGFPFVGIVLIIIATILGTNEETKMNETSKPIETKNHKENTQTSKENISEKSIESKETKIDN